MSKTERSLLKSFIVFVLLIAIGIVATVWYRERSAITAEASAGPQSFGVLIPTPTPKKQSSVQETSVHSSNADKQLILRTTKKSDGTTQYSYIIADISGTNPRVLFDKT